MDRICPYLVLADDARSVVDGFDAEHRCTAVDPHEALPRSRQLGICLTDEHRTCERFTAAEAAAQRESANLPRPAPDAVIVSTRLVLDPDPAWRRLGAGTLVAGRNGRRLVVGGVVGALGVGVVAVAAAGGFTGLVGANPATPTPVPTSTATPTPLPTEAPTARPTAVPTPVPTPQSTAEPTPVPTPAPTPQPTQRTYVVQAGDTLGRIASQFGTTVQAIMDANNLTTTVINIGQVLVIP